MKQHEAVIEVMRANGGFATLGFLYREVMQVPDVVWKTKTPFASIRRIVQDSRFFFKIRPGLWALEEWRDRLPFKQALSAERASAVYADFSHSYFQGLLVEIGNLRGFTTFVPAQDQNREFLGRPLSQFASVTSIFPFAYPELLKRARTIDVIWFNERKMPNTFFEVEHSTDIKGSLLKFCDLRDFNASFRIVADKSRFRDFNTKVAFSAFNEIETRVKFIDYDTVSQVHSKASELAVLEEKW